MTLQIQVSILKDYRTKAIVVRRVATNKGSNTLGVDGKVLKIVKDQIELAKAVHQIMRNPSTYKLNFVKRVWIPKSNGEKNLWVFL